jgi:glycosyltransferase involved in cell wall biosynthesis
MPEVKFSVIVPCYNRPHFVGEAVNSVLSQAGDFELAEVIVVDDHSDDVATLEKLQEISLQKKVRLVTNPDHKGISGARNFGAQIATAEWLAFLDDDDVWLPGMLQRFVEAIRAYPQAKWFGGDFFSWRPGRPVPPTTHYHDAAHVQKYIGAAFSTNAPLLLREPLSAFIDVFMSLPSATVVSKLLLLSVGGFDCDPSILHAEDYDLFIRLACVTDFVFVPGARVLYRRHAASATGKEQQPHMGAVLLFHRLLRDSRFASERRRIREKLVQFRLDNAIYHRRRREFLLAISDLLVAIAHHPFYDSGRAWRYLAASILRRA